MSEHIIEPELILTPWKKLLLDTMVRAREKIMIISPFIKFGIVSELYSKLRALPILIQTITRFKSDDFACGASDLDAAYALSGLTLDEGGAAKFEIRADNRLHAKIYLIDQRVAFVGSSNLTFSGLSRNYEAAVCITNPDFLKNIVSAVSELWAAGQSVSQNDFQEMILQLRTNAQPTRREYEHVYDLHKARSVFAPETEESELSDAWLIEAIDSPPEPHQPVPRIANVIHDATIPEQSPAFAEGNLESEVPVSREVKYKIDKIIKNHRNLTNQFIELLHNRFGIHIKWAEPIYVSVIAYPSLAGFYRKYGVTVENEAESIAANLPRKQIPESFLSLGRYAFEAACFQIGLKSGILGKFGPSAIALLHSAAKRARILPMLWDQNFLGPLLTLPADKPSDRSYKDASLRLFGAITYFQNLEESIRVIEEFFNPLDILGSDIGSVLSYKDSKTALQEVAQGADHRRPIYTDYRSEGQTHEQTWHCSVSVGAAIISTGNGASKGEAEEAAANEALNIMTEHRTWRKAIDEYKKSELTKLRNDATYSVSPKIRITTNDARQVLDAYRNILGFELDPIYGIQALIDRGTQRSKRYRGNNEVLSCFGGALFPVFLIKHIIKEEKPASLFSISSKSIYDSMIDVFRIHELRKAMNIGTEVAREKSIDCAQAIIASLVITRGSSEAALIFTDQMSALAKRAEQATATAVRDMSGDARIRALPDGFDPSISYVQILQEFAQSKGDRLPDFIAIQRGLGHEPDFEVGVTYLGHHGRGSGGRVREARAKAAFALLIALKRSLEQPTG